MKKSLFLFLFLLVSSLSVQAQSDRFQKKNKKAEPATEAQEESPSQEDKKQEASTKKFTDRLVYGGGAGFSTGTAATSVFLAPQVGYQFNDNLVAGIGYMYNYARWRQLWNPFTGDWEAVDLRNQIHGPNIFANYSIFDRAFVGSQFEVLNHDVYSYNLNTGSQETNNTWTPVLFVQAGILQKVGSKGFIMIGARLNVLHDENSPYAQSWAPIFQVFF